MNRLFFGLLVPIALFAACNTQKRVTKFRFEVPEAGTIVRVGEAVLLKLVFPPDINVDSVVYAVDGEVFARRTDSSAVTLYTDSSAFGSRTLSARLYHGGNEQVAYSNIVVVPPTPKRYGFRVIEEYPHDTDAYTQGLEFDASGVLFESTGRNGKSTLRRVDYRTGRPVQQVALADEIFGEGLTIVGNRVIQLTYRNGTGLVYDKSNLNRIGEFSYGTFKEGWGLCSDGHRLILSDGSSRLYFLNKDTYAEEGFIEVYNDKGPLEYLNELEYIDGKVYANVYTKDFIVIIDPQTGAVEGEINLIGIYQDKADHDNELNGIAYDREGKRLFVTGKLWPKLYVIELVKQ